MDSKKSHMLEESWLHRIPHSRMVYPDTLLDKTKYIFWRFYTPYHHIVRNKAQRLGFSAIYFAKHDRTDRQNYLLGVVAPHLSIEEFVLALIERGFGNHFVAWKDDGEIVSLRYVEDFTCQYHVRVFHDREVRAHYEYTPESRPVSHIKARGQEERREEFLRMFGDIIQSV